MKTLKINTILSLALILFAVTSATAKSTNNPKPAGSSVNVRYEVNIQFAASEPLCNSYLVEILDASGNMVAPAQVFIPGQDLYTFYEQTRLTIGIRIARLVLAPKVYHFTCEQELFTPPAVKVIHFIDRQTYSKRRKYDDHQTRNDCKRNDHCGPFGKTACENRRRLLPARGHLRRFCRRVRGSQVVCSRKCGRHGSDGVENVGNDAIGLAQLGDLRGRLELDTLHAHLAQPATRGNSATHLGRAGKQRRFAMTMWNFVPQAYPPTGAVTRPPRPRMRGPLGPVKPS